MWARNPTFVLLARYLTVGGVSALIEFAIFSGLAGLAELPVMVANVIAVSTVTVLGFLGQKRFTFRDGGRITPQAILYVCQVSVNFLLNNALVYLFAEVMKIPPFAAKP